MLVVESESLVSFAVFNSDFMFSFLSVLGLDISLGLVVPFFLHFLGGGTGGPALCLLPEIKTNNNFSLHCRGLYTAVTFVRGHAQKQYV